MRTTLNIDSEKLGKLMKLLGSTSKTETIELAIDEALRARARERLKALAGTLELAEDWRELRQLDQ